MTEQFNKDVHASNVTCEFEFETPIGPRTFTYSKWRHDDRIEGSYRGQEFTFVETRAQLVREIEKIEAEFQAKEKINKKRRDVAKNPVEAHLVVLPNPSRNQPFAIEEVKVRGVDQRSKGLMVTRANGDKETIDRNSMSGYSMNTKSVVVTLDSAGSFEDLWAAWHRIAEAEAQVEPHKPSYVKDILGVNANTFSTQASTRYPIEVVFDPETWQRSTVFEGKTYTGPDSKDVEEQVRSVLLHQAGWHLDSHGKEHTQVRSFDYAFRDRAHYDAHSTAKGEAEKVSQVFVDLVKDLEFDRSLVEVQDEPEPQSAEDSEQSVPRVSAPQHNDDWED